MANWTLTFYETPRGDRPVADYIDRLPAKDADKVVRQLELLSEFGTRLGPPHVKAMQGSSLWELRVRGRNHHRVFYVAVSNDEMILLHAFGKKSQKTPRKEISTAEARLQEYRSRH